MSSINIIMALDDIGLDMLPVPKHCIMNGQAPLGSIHEVGNSGSTRLDDVGKMFGLSRRVGLTIIRVLYLS